MLAVFFATLLATASAENQEKYLQAFPLAEVGVARYVIALPHKEDGEDDDFRVEITVGKELLTDGVNLARLGGALEAKPLKGWGFTYYEVAKFGPAATTLMAVPPGTAKVKKFVSIPSLTIPYNSRIPLVVYVPEGGEVRYRIWKAAETSEKAEKG